MGGISRLQNHSHRGMGSRRRLRSIPATTPLPPAPLGSPLKIKPGRLPIAPALIAGILNPMAKLSGVSSAPTHDEIAAQAYEIYLRDGCVPGRDIEHWLRAESELLLQRNNGNTATAKSVVQPISNTLPAPLPAGAPLATTPPRSQSPRRSQKRERELASAN